MMTTLGYGISAYVPPAPQQAIYGSEGYWPSPRRKTKKEIDDERRERLGLTPAVVEAIAEVKPQRRRITLQDLIGKTRAAKITSVDMTAAIAASRRRKRQKDDEMLLLM